MTRSPLKYRIATGIDPNADESMHEPKNMITKNRPMGVNAQMPHSARAGLGPLEPGSLVLEALS